MIEHNCGGTIRPQSAHCSVEQLFFLWMRGAAECLVRVGSTG